jgi:hypothetical protein
MESKKGKLRRLWQWISHVHVASWLYGMAASLFLQWNVIVSAAFAVAAAYWAWIAHWGYLPVFLVAFGIFVSAIWGLNGIIWLKHQKQPSDERISFDYAYGLALEDITLAIEREKEESALQFGLRFRNAASGPMRFYVEEFDVILKDRTIARPTFINRGGFIPRDSSTIFFYPPFSKKVLDECSPRSDGVLRYSVIYGHPESPYLRRTKKKLILSVRLEATPGVAYLIETESDEPIRERWGGGSRKPVQAG